jgi:Gluconate kinase
MSRIGVSRSESTTKSVSAKSKERRAESGNKTVTISMIVIVMGVSGSGKTTVGKLVAERMGWRFDDADDYHSAENKAKMGSGQPLTDQDRAPWLASLRVMIEDRLEKNQGTVVACSALKSDYRKLLVPAAVAGTRGGKQVPSNEQLPLPPDQKPSDNQPRIVFLYLKASFDEIASRLAHRKHEFMNPNLLKSQFQTLEEPTDSEGQQADSEGQPTDFEGQSTDSEGQSTDSEGQSTDADGNHVESAPNSEPFRTIVVDTAGLTAEQVADVAVSKLS